MRELGTPIPIVDRIYGWASSRATRNLALTSLLWLASGYGVLALQARVAANTGGRPVPDIIPFYRPQQFLELLEQYGEPGRGAFLLFTLYDVFYPIVAYGLACLALCALLRPFHSARPYWRYAVVLPAAGLTVELAEQAGFLCALFWFPARSSALATTISVLSAIKLVLLGLLVLLLSLLAGARSSQVVWRLTRRCSRRGPRSRGHDGSRRETARAAERRR
jgi:hypothetical protein